MTRDDKSPRQPDPRPATDHSGEPQAHRVLRPDTERPKEAHPRSLQNRPLDPNSAAEKRFPPGVDAADVFDPGRQTPGAPPVDNRSGRKN
ncbi:hypothetical protein [Bordetella bronchialis]|uniref:Uncharacterized protein n=1 Tax=Bordetella bronchialis TaxID=463025 RepID=A0A193G2B9_9BORD|nr:hypothetical protein [Bordetella bronchialis]ANN68449.1 hypothetical protein BAU06_21015 [Bordetella bronchialis]ANN73591.1 hypothetical protein BAU08_21550 [Bordetella bronchialis]